MIEFGTNENWRYQSDWVEFTVKNETQTIRCKVSREAIEDHYGDCDTDEERLNKAKEHFDEITDEIGHIILAGRFEDDGTILLRSKDW